MKIVIPLSGLGSRFKEAGYQAIKPLIEVEGKPIIEWVLKLFPNEDDILFICREEHLNDTSLKDILLNLKPKAQVISIPGHKLGPVYAVLQAADYLEDNEPVICSYCDYYMHWNYANFLKRVNQNNCDGAIPCYTGFHPHLIPKKNLYASCKVTKKQELIEIKEKFSFTPDKTKSLHSPGIYYFKNATLLNYYFKQLIDHNLSLNGEYYISLVYNQMVKDGLFIDVPDNVSHFCQWGTPEDLEEYLFWTSQIKGIKR